MRTAILFHAFGASASVVLHAVTGATCVGGDRRRIGSVAWSAAEVSRGQPAGAPSMCASHGGWTRDASGASDVRGAR